MSTTNYLVPQDSSSTVLDSDVDSLFNAYNTAFASANTIALQPAFSTKLLATLPEDQALAATHATTFITGWGFGVANTFLSGLNSLASFVSTLLRTGLAPTAASLDQLLPNSAEFQSTLASFRSYLSSIIAMCCQVDPNSQSILLNMQSIHDKLAELALQIGDDRTKLDTAVQEVKSDGTIQALLKQQQTLQQKFAEVNSQLAKGATTTIAQDIAFGFSFAKEFLDGINPGAIAGSALELAGEVEAIEQFNEENKQLLEQQAELGAQIVALVKNIAQDQEDQLELTLVAAQVDIFATQIQNLLAYMGSVLSQLKGWANPVNLLASYTTPPSAGFYTAQVAAGQAFWSGLFTETARYQSILALSSR
jgi:hypothetical protein